MDIRARQVLPISVNALLNNVVRIASNKDIEIEIINEPFPYTYEEKKKKKVAINFQLYFL